MICNDSAKLNIQTAYAGSLKVVRDQRARCSHVPQEEELVAAAQGGDHEAFTALCQRYSGNLMRLLIRITRNHHDAEDALQDCFFNAFIHLADFQNKSKFSTWLSRVAFNSGLAILRKRRRSVLMPLERTSDDGSTSILEIAADEPDAEIRMIMLEKSFHLHHALKRLPATLREVMELRIQTESRVDEIAKTVGISTAAAKSRLMRARSRVRRSLERRIAL